MTADNQPRWQLAQVVETAVVADNIRRITFRRPPSGRAQPGCHIDVQVPLGETSDIRSYSVVASSEESALVTISVLRSRQSRGGSEFMHRLQVADTLMTTQPLQNFPLRVGASRYLLVAGGIGITAIYGMAETLRALKADYQLVYVGRSSKAMAYLSNLTELHGERLRVHVDQDGTPLDASGLVDGIAASSDGMDTELYMCGPIRLMDAIRRQWGERGLPVYNLRYETFGNSGWFEPEDFIVRIPRLGLETTVGTHSTILEALTAAGADLMFDCRKGECGLCQVDVRQVDGVIDHRDVFFGERQLKASTKICTCVSRVVSTANARRQGIGGTPVDEAPQAPRDALNPTPVLTIDVP